MAGSPLALASRGRLRAVDSMLPFAETPSRLLLAIVGIALLVAGRRLFWLAVGMLGFIAGYQAMERWGSGLPHTAAFVVAIARGRHRHDPRGRRAARGGGARRLPARRRARHFLLPLTGLALGPWHGLVVAAAGLLMAFVALGIFSLALVVLTAGAGAAMLAEAIAAPPPWGVALLVVLWVIGVVVQRRSQAADARGAQRPSARSAAGW